MWSDPIDNALASMQTLVNQLLHGLPPTRDVFERAQSSLVRAREVREFEQQQDRLVTAEDRW